MSSSGGNRRIAQRPRDSSSSSSSSDVIDEDYGTQKTPKGGGGSSSKATPKATQQQQFNDDDVKKLVCDVVFFILSQEEKRAPVKKADVFKATNLTGKHRDLQEKVFTQARRKLQNVLGIQMMESRSKSGKGTFFLINKIPEEMDQQHLTWSERENGRTGILNTVLTVIFMSNGVILDEELWKFLRKVGVYDEACGAHGPGGGGGVANRKDTSTIGGGLVSPDVRDLFGDVKTLVFREWGQKQQYLDISKLDSGDTDNPKHEIRWGQRAHMEVKKSDLLKVVSSMYKVDPRSFKKEYDQVLKEEGGEAMEEGDEVDE